MNLGRLAVAYNILCRWKKRTPSPNECAGHNDVKQTEILTAEQLVCEPSVLKIEFSIENTEG